MVKTESITSFDNHLKKMLRISSSLNILNSVKKIRYAAAKGKPVHVAQIDK